MAHILIKRETFKKYVEEFKGGEITFDQFCEKIYSHTERFVDILKQEESLDCELIIGGCDMPATFVWESPVGDHGLTDEGYECFKGLIESPATRLPNGNIKIEFDDEGFGEDFVYEAAGYVSETKFNAWFKEY